MRYNVLTGTAFKKLGRFTRYSTGIS